MGIVLSFFRSRAYLGRVIEQPNTKLDKTLHNKSAYVFHMLDSASQVSLLFITPRTVRTLCYTCVLNYDILG